MCPGNHCPLKDTCFRFKAKPNEYYQAYFLHHPIGKKGKCEYYWPISPVDSPKRNAGVVSKKSSAAKSKRRQSSLQTKKSSGKRKKAD